uniref:Uncharacterized protein LOC111122639 isoform X3 n=1 Tax=Crassostrea virginica TaxID=6565 RepID=A0A8B8CWE9_CRAVI|nr:uncharacterized protein LOC111122639 isoform X3 [Crassostrea virginica]
MVHPPFCLFMSISRENHYKLCVISPFFKRKFTKTKMTADVSQLNGVFPVLLESIFMSSSLAVILIDWNHSFLETSLLRLLQSYLPRWRKRNIRQDVYICLVILALSIMYTNSLKNFAINMENCRIAATSIVVLLSFWLQSKTKSGNTSDQCVGTPTIEVSHKSVGKSLVAVQDQESSASTCCGSGVPQFLLSLLPPASSEPQPEVNIKEELRRDYVKEFRLQFDKEDVSEEKLINAILYLNTLRGGIAAHREMDRLTSAVDHMNYMYMDSRLDDSGFPMEYSYKELRDIVLEEKLCPFKDFDRVVEMHLKTSGFLPSPEEFVDFYHETKGIVELEREVKETRQEMEEVLEKSQRVVEETTQEVVQSRQKNESLQQRLRQQQQALQQHQQALQQHQQALQQHQQAFQQERLTSQQHQQTIQQKDQTIQQKDRIIQQERQQSEQKDRLLQQERQRVRELEQNPEGEFQRRLREMEEEIRRLSARSQRAMCKICLVEEVEVSFTPCNHLVSCQECASSLTDEELSPSQRKCPMCREDIKGTVRMFFA